MNEKSFDVLDLNVALSQDMMVQANRIIDAQGGVPPLERGQWIARQVSNYADSISRFGKDRLLIGLHMGMLIGMQLEPVEESDDE